MLASERDPRLDRLFALTDGVYAIALTLLAIELALLEASEHLHGDALLQSILDSWPKVLSFLTSLTLIAIFWHGNHRAFHYLRCFDGRLAYLVLLQLLCIAFIPFPTALSASTSQTPWPDSFTSAPSLLPGLLRWHYDGT